MRKFHRHINLRDNCTAPIVVFLAFALSPLAVCYAGEAAFKKVDPSDPMTAEQPGTPTGVDVAQVNGPAQPAASSDAAARSETSKDNADQLQDIVVTGSRITRDGFQAPTPVTVVTAADIEAAAAVNVGAYLNQLPSLNNSNTPATARQLIGGSLAGANLLNLRDLGTNRTLVLLDGRRVSPSFLTGEVDVNTIPTALIQRVDIVTGGASAAWGSDAVAGVVNFVLDTKFTGLQLEAQGGATTHGDAGNGSGSIAYGTGFADDRGHFEIAADYSEMGTAIAGDRDWFRGYKLLVNPAFAPGNGQPARLILPNTSLLDTAGGLVPSGPLRGLQFGANGQPLPTPFNFGSVLSGNLVSGSTDADDPARVNQLVAPFSQGNVFMHANFKATERVSVFGEFSYGDSHSTNLATSFFSANPKVAIDNAFLPVSVQTQMLAAGVSSIPIASSYLNLGLAEGINDRSAMRYTGGFNAVLTDRWSVDGYLQRGVSRIQNAAVDDVQPARLANAFDSVIDPATGNPVCRSTLAAPGNGCVPLNPFGTATPNTLQSSYLFGTSDQHTEIAQNVASLTAHGEPFSVPAGRVSVAFGGEYRRDSAVNTANAASIAKSFLVGNYQPFEGAVNVQEGFGEILVPVLKDSAIGKELNLNGAARITDYSVSGTVNTWKLGATFKPIDDVTLRVTRSRDIRAPSLSELFLGGSVTRSNVTDPSQGNAPVNFLDVTSGNINLKPEIARTLTAGIVFQPHWLAGLNASIDFYDIKIADAIGISSVQEIVNECYAGDTKFCSLITRDISGTIQQINVAPVNQQVENARGVDLEAAYRVALWGGSFTFRALLDYVDELNIEGPGVSINAADEVGDNLGALQGEPRWRGLATAAYDSGRWSLQLKERFIGASKIESSYGPLDVNLNDVPAIFYTDVFAAYTPLHDHRNVQLFLAVDNLFDRAPPVVVSQDSLDVISIGTNVVVYDTLGRMLRAGFRVKF